MKHSNVYALRGFPFILLMGGSSAGSSIALLMRGSWVRAPPAQFNTSSWWLVPISMTKSKERLTHIES